MLSVIMILSIFTLGISARSYSEAYIGERSYTIKSGTTQVGSGTFDFGTVSEPGAYSSCTRSSGNYATAYCKLESKSAGGTVIKTDFGYNPSIAYAYISTAYASSTLDGIWIICNLTSSGTIPPGSPSEPDTGIPWYW